MRGCLIEHAVGFSVAKPRRVSGEHAELRAVTDKPLQTSSHAASQPSKDFSINNLQEEQPTRSVRY